MVMENPKQDTIVASENDDEDFGCFFLQPSSSPYNITEKVQQANFDLFNSNLSNEKTAKVKFKEDLVSYEPDLTDDDVNSITSDISDENSEAESCNYKTTLNPNVNAFEIHEELFEEEEVMEEIIEDEHSAGVESVKTSSKDLENNTAEDVQSSGQSSNRKINKKRCCNSNKNVLSEVHCKDHCIEKIDYNLSMSIKRLEIQEKPLNLPPLQLRPRKCCEELKQVNSSRNLPTYNGLRSEYGLSQRQLESRQKQLEQLRKKEMARLKLIEEYKSRKTQQNEKIFCQWLKEVSKRNKNSATKFQKPKEGFSPNVVNLTEKYSFEKVKQRPKTANEFVPKTNIKKKKRPHTTQSCVYIEVPQRVLERGINIGDLLITNSKMFTKKLHILTVS